MIRILGIDTAAGACSVALWRDGAILCHSEAIERGHAERLVPMVLAVLEEARVRFAALDALAVSIGPGAFTGLRIGLAAARGMALAAGLPCFGVTTLDAIADDVGLRRAAGVVPADLPLLVALDTKRRDFYGQLFAADATPLTAPQVGDADGLARLVRGAHTLVAGDGMLAVAAALASVGGMGQTVADCATPVASAVARIAARRWQRGERPADSPSPLYLRAAATGTPSAAPQSVP